MLRVLANNSSDSDGTRKHSDNHDDEHGDGSGGGGDQEEERTASTGFGGLCEVHLGFEPESLERPSKRPLSRRAYLARLRKSVFALAPSGNNPETFRHWEALESGAIPVSVAPPRDRSYLEHWCRPPGENQHHQHRGGPSGGAVSLFAAHRRVGGEDGSSPGTAKLPPWSLKTFAARGCPLIILDSWRQLPEMLGYFSNGSSTTQAALHRNSALADKARGTRGGGANGSVRPSLHGELDGMQRLGLVWVQRIKDDAARDISNLLAKAVP